jgi:hypothetical protein
MLICQVGKDCNIIDKTKILICQVEKDCDCDVKERARSPRCSVVMCSNIL